MKPRPHPARRLLTAALLLALAACQPAPPPPDDRTPTAGPPAATAAPTTAPTALPTPALGATQEPAPTPPPGATPTPAPAGFFDDRRLFYEPDFYGPQIQAFLEQQPGPLKRMRFSVGGRSTSFTDVVLGQACYYGVNPRVILALIESQSHLLSDAAPTGDQLGWAVGFDGDRGNWRGVQAQVRWAVRQIFYARRDYPAKGPLTFADGSTAPPDQGLTLSQYVLARVLAPTTTPGGLGDRMARFRDTYAALFGDPRLPPEGWPAPAAPFLRRPLAKTAAVTSFFDHDAPFLTRDPNGSVVTYWGRAETDNAFAYDGHDGWDYAAAAPDRALAAAAGVVVFAGNADDGCATQAVVVDHENGYRTLYWHLARVDVEQGQRVAAGDPVGIVGESGCALGPHLHFGTQYLGHNMDPYGWCGAGADPWAANAGGARSTWLWADRPSPCGPPPPGAVVVDTDSPGFVRLGEGWADGPSGYGGSAIFIPSLRGASAGQPWQLRPLRSPAVAIWRAPIAKTGRYRVIAYVPYALSGLEDPKHLEYRIRSADGEAAVAVDARTTANDWADLGTYSFHAGEEAAVVLSNLTEENRLSVWADAVMWVPAD